MSRGVCLVLVVVVAVAGCRKGKDPAVCRTDAHSLSAYLGSIDRDAPPFWAGDLKLVLRPDLPRVELRYAPVLEIRADRLVLDGSMIDNHADLEDRLRGRHEAAVRDVELGTSRHNPPDPTLLNLLIDERAPWEIVVEVADTALAAGFDHPAVAFARPPAAITRPPRAPIDDELDRAAAAEPSQRATQFARSMQKVVASCPALIRVFGEIGSSDGGDKSQQLLDGLEPALVECNCRVDLPALRSVFFRLFYVEHPVTAVAVVLAADGRAVVQPASTPWRDAHELITAGAPLHLAVAQ